MELFASIYNSIIEFLKEEYYVSGYYISLWDILLVTTLLSIVGWIAGKLLNMNGD